MLKSNYLIINKKAREFSEMRIAGRTAVFLGRSGKPVDFGVLRLDDSVYAVLACEQAKLIMLVSDRQREASVTGIIWRSAEDYSAGLAAVRETSGKSVSKQDLRISSYAWSIAEKLEAGVRIKVTDSVDRSEMIVCPECGMLNPKGTEYCLECGEELP